MLMNPIPSILNRWCTALVCAVILQVPLTSAEPVTEPKPKIFRPKTGVFPPMEKAHAYRGELVFVDHPNRRGSLRVAGDGKF
jgi:hypothetical protein